MQHPLHQIHPIFQLNSERAFFWSVEKNNEKKKNKKSN